jgi:hypothetical protein
MVEESKEISKEDVKGNKPVFKASFGNCSGALWANDTVKGKMLSATFQKYYKDKDGNDRHSDIFGVNDLPKLKLCVQAVYAEAVCNRQKLLEE